MSAILIELEEISYNIVFVSGWVVGVLLLLLRQKRPMILGATYFFGAFGVFIEQWLTYHEFNKWINLIFGLIFLSSVVLQGIFFISLFFDDKKWYKYFKFGSLVFSIVLTVLIVLYMDIPASTTDPHLVGIVNHNIILIPMFVYIIPILLVSVVNLVKMLSHIPKHEQSEIKLLYVGLMIFIFTLIIGEINITASNLLMVFGFVMTGVAYIRMQRKKSESAVKTESSRLKSLDSTRGFGIITIIYAHLFAGLWKGPDLNQWMNDPLILFMGLFANLASIFFMSAGISAPFSMIKQAQNNIHPKVILKNQMIRSLFLIVVGTLYDPLVYGYWGIVDTLQISGLSIFLVSLVVYFLYLRHDPTAQNPVKLQQLFKSMLWIAIIILVLSPPVRLLVGYPIEDPSVGLIVSYATPHTFFESVQAWLTTSFFPIFPCTAYFFIGGAIGCYLFPNQNNAEVLRKVARKLLIVSSLVLLGTAILFFAGDTIITTIGDRHNIDYYSLDFNDLPSWVIELTLNLQPFTTVGFMLFLFFPLFFLGLFMYIHDIPHGKVITSLKNFVRDYLGGKVLFDTFRRFSHCSLTIYILQFAWMVVLRLIYVFTGVQLLYSEPSLFIVMGWVVISVISFAVFALFFEKIQYKYGFEWLSHKVQRRVMEGVKT